MSLFSVAGVALELGTMVIGPEDVILLGILKAKGLIVKGVTRGGKKILAIFNKAGTEVVGKELKALQAEYEAAAAAKNGIRTLKPSQVLDLTGESVGFSKKAYNKATGFVYVLRDKTTGEVLKVGKTTGGVNIYERMNMYRRKSQQFGHQIEAEVWEVGTSREALDLETEIRKQMKAEGYRLPWDAVANPGRPDLGLPWDRKSGTRYEIPD